MAVKRKNTTGIFAPKNRKFLIAGGVAAIAGIYLLAGDKIKDLFKKDTSDEMNTPMPTIAPLPDPVIINRTIVTPGSNNDGLDPDKQLRKGVKGDEVKRIQIIANYLANLFGVTTLDVKANGKNFGSVTFPLQTDGDFGENTHKAIILIRGKNYLDAGYTTLDKMRFEYAYWSGYYGKDFPDSLRSSLRFQRYSDAYKTGKIDAQK
jgi:hypothetical protein